jgi:hypothetical protein
VESTYPEFHLFIGASEQKEGAVAGFQFKIPLPWCFSKHFGGNCGNLPHFSYVLNAINIASFQSLKLLGDLFLLDLQKATLFLHHEETFVELLCLE